MHNNERGSILNLGPKFISKTIHYQFPSLLSNFFIISFGYLQNESELSLECLDPRETEDLNKIYRVKRRRDYLIGRYLAKVSIAKYLKNIELNQIIVYRGLANQPILSLPSHHTHNQVSIAHSNGYGVTVAYKEDILLGVDVELIDHSKSHFFGEYLEGLNHNLPFSNNIVGLLIFTAKEALVKSIKLGLIFPIHLLRVKDIIMIDNSYFVIKFENFDKFKVICIKIYDVIISIAYQESLGLLEKDLKEFSSSMEEFCNSGLF
ncbi:4'-phosphopantetheinyl transferase family protein [Rossellomorea sp. LjRoot5]|uniref:4'-phosphopantetheinyl transferase family protein n=1 Tax=Rossellomorea sp. LjRoot5 TaxID=3342331 RepID=UPI003ED08196